MAVQCCDGSVSGLVCKIHQTFHSVTSTAYQQPACSLLADQDNGKWSRYPDDGAAILIIRTCVDLADHGDVLEQ